MAAVKVFRGDTWERAWILRRADGSALDLTGARARLHVRDAAGALVVEASIGNGRITIDPAAGRIDMRVPADVMAAVAPGQYHTNTWETARRVDGGKPGSASGTGRTLAGSGPLPWRHDCSPAGIADLVGNIWEFTPGFRLVDGEIQVMENNNAATAALFDDTAAWKAIRASDGALVAPGTAGTLKYDALSAYSDNGIVNDLGNFEIDSKIDFYNGPVGNDSTSYDYNSMPFASLAAASGVTIPAILRALLLAPTSGLSLDGRVWMRNHGKRYPLRGGSWYYGANAGLGALSLYNPASLAYSDIGARPAKV